MTRSEIMSRIKSRGNKSTELAFMGILRRHGVKGWRRHAKVLGIRPDFVFAKTKIAVFVDGCFWHGCRRHCDLSKLKVYWKEKICRNMMRDLLQTYRLQDSGWRVVRLWEHTLKGENA